MRQVSAEKIEARRSQGGHFRTWNCVPFRSTEKLRWIRPRSRMTWISSAGSFSNSASSTICQVAGWRRGKWRSGSGTSASHSTGKSEIQATVSGRFSTSGARQGFSERPPQDGARRARVQAPSPQIRGNTKYQTPNTRKAPSSKHQIHLRVEFGAWCLVFFWCLVFGVWCLVFPLDILNLNNTNRRVAAAQTYSLPLA